MANRAPLFALLGAALAFVLALTLFGSGTETVTDTTSSTFQDLAIPDPEIPTGTAPRVPVRQAEVTLHRDRTLSAVPDLDGMLLVVVGQAGRGHWILVGDPVERSEVQVQLPRIAHDFSVDSSGSLLSYLDGHDDASTRWLVSFKPQIATFEMPHGTDSFVWSGDEAGTAAWLEADPAGGRRRIILGEHGSAGMTTVADLGATTGPLAGLNAAGYWTQFEDPAVPRTGFVAFQPRDDTDGWLISSDLVIPPPSGSRALLAHLDAASWRWNFGLNEDGIIPLAWAPGDAGGEYGFAAFSPDSRRLAFIGADRTIPAGSWVEVWPTTGGDGTRLTIPYRVWDVSWSPRGKFVVMPGTDNEGTHVVLLLDTTTDDLHAVEFDDWVQFAAVVGGGTPGTNVGGPSGA